MRLGGDRVYCYAEAAGDEPVPPDGDWRELFADFTGPVPELLESGADAHFAPLAEIDGDDWIAGNVVLIGDAAHACSPSMAQGGAMALEDSLVLAELLADGPVGTALAGYRERRAARIAWVLAQNRRRDRARALPTPVRDLVLRTVGPRLITANHAPLLTMP